MYFLHANDQDGPERITVDIAGKYGQKLISLHLLLFEGVLDIALRGIRR